MAAKLGPHEALLADRIASALPESISAVVLLRELGESGYGRHHHPARAAGAAEPAVAVKPVVRFETKPGRQMQVNWAAIRRGAEFLRSQI